MTTLNEEFSRLGQLLDQLLSLLEEADDRFWQLYIKRGLRQVEEQKLGGATYILGCYGGQDTFSDLKLGGDLRDSDPIRYQNLNGRLESLRNQVFESANLIASRKLW